MKKYAIIAAIAAMALLVIASFAMAAPGEYLEGTDGESVHDTVYWLNQNLDGDGSFKPDPLRDDAPLKMPDGSRIVNANRTGFDDIDGFDKFARNVSGQNVHTDFQFNTNSCASCHATHTAQYGDMLLFRSSIYATCIACHDGSGIPFFNVFTPSEQIVADTVYQNSLTGQHRVSGTFNVNFDMGGSIHLPTGDVWLAAAPGGNRLNKDRNNDELIQLSGSDNIWEQEFTCTSCHAPHGSFSYRLLHGNPNNINQRTSAHGGLKLVDYAATYAADLNAAIDVGPADEGWYVLDTLSGTGANSVRVYPFSRVSNSVIIKDDTGTITGNMDIDYVNGYFTLKDGAPAVVGAVKVDIIRILKVFIPEGAKAAAPGTSDDSGANASVTIANRMQYQSGINYNFFCASCHTDYERALATRDFNDLDVYGQDTDESDSINRRDATGFFSAAHRHTTWRGGNNSMEVVGLRDDTGGGQQMMCVSCHFVHGTDSYIMKTGDELVIGVKGTEETEGDVNVSSALKRYTNMSVCLKCHSGLVTDTEWYETNREAWNPVRSDAFNLMLK